MQYTHTFTKALINPNVATDAAAAAWLFVA